MNCIVLPVSVHRLDHRVKETHAPLGPTLVQQRGGSPADWSNFSPVGGNIASAEAEVNTDTLQCALRSSMCSLKLFGND